MLNTHLMFEAPLQHPIYNTAPPPPAKTVEAKFELLNPDKFIPLPNTLKQHIQYWYC